MRQRVSSGSPFESVIGFSRAVRVGNRIVVSGTAPVDPAGVAPNVYGQAKRCLEIIVKAIEELGGSADDVVRTRTYLVNADDWKEVGRAHGEVFSVAKPASTMLVVGGLLDPAWLVEIEAEAVIGDDE